VTLTIKRAKCFSITRNTSVNCVVFAVGGEPRPEKLRREELRLFDEICWVYLWSERFKVDHVA
jgi:hypothetical protein